MSSPVASTTAHTAQTARSLCSQRPVLPLLTSRRTVDLCRVGSCLCRTA